MGLWLNLNELGLLGLYNGFKWRMFKLQTGFDEDARRKTNGDGDGD